MNGGTSSKIGLTECKVLHVPTIKGCREFPCDEQKKARTLLLGFALFLAHPRDKVFSGERPLLSLDIEEVIHGCM